ncbi:MAG: tetratricopeptide repeat protein [Desulfobaccales bacterium]
MKRSLIQFVILLPALLLTFCGPALSQGDAAVAAKINAGYDLLEQGKYAEARKVYEEVLQKQPDHPLALNNLAAISCKQGKYDEALALLKKALPKAGGYKVTLNRVCNVDGVCAAYRMDKDGSGQENLEDVIKSNMVMVSMAAGGRPGK